MSNERAKILTVPEQHAAIKRTSSRRASFDLSTQLFNDKIWTNDLQNGLEDPRIDPPSSDLYRLIGLVGILAAQYGFPTLQDIAIRRNMMGSTKPLLDPRRLLAVSVYTARANEQANEIKKELEKEVDESLRPGIWGIRLKISKGKVKPLRVSQKKLKLQAAYRMRIPRAIVLPDEPLNRNLARIAFTYRGVDEMTDGEFAETVLPTVKPILEEFVHPVELFSMSNKA